MPEQPKSRLDREIDEILEKKAREPIDFRSHPRVQSQQGSKDSLQRREQVLSAWDWLKSMPLVLAYVFAIVAILVRDFSPLLALLLSTGAVVSIWLPGMMRLIRPPSSPNETVKYWRGRPYTSEIKSAVSRHPIDSLKRYFDRRR